MSMFDHLFPLPPTYSMKHSNCYMVWGGDIGNSSQQARFNQEDLVVGCLVDVATGLMTFTANGKEINAFYQVRQAERMCVCVREYLRSVLEMFLSVGVALWRRAWGKG